jgi:hypothetical protein
MILHRLVEIAKRAKQVLRSRGQVGPTGSRGTGKGCGRHGADPGVPLDPVGSRVFEMSYLSYAIVGMKNVHSGGGERMARYIGSVLIRLGTPNAVLGRRRQSWHRGLRPVKL